MNQRQENIQQVVSFVRRVLELNPDGVPGYRLEEEVQGAFYCTRELATDYVSAALKACKAVLARDGWAPRVTNDQPTLEQVGLVREAVHEEAGIFAPGSVAWWEVRERFYKKANLRHEALFWNAVIALQDELKREYDLNEYGLCRKGAQALARS